MAPDIRRKHRLPGRPPGTSTGGKNATELWPEYPESNPLIFKLFLFYVAFWYLQGGYRFPQLGAIRLEFILGAILSIAASLSLVGTRLPSTHRPSGIFQWIVSLFCIVLIMVALSVTPGASWILFVDRVLKFAMMALFICAFITSPNRLRWFLVAYLLSFLKMTLEGIQGFISGSLVWQNQGIPRLHGATPNYAHPNSFSGTQLGTLPFLVNLLPIASRWMRPVMVVQAIGAILIVVTTGSRTGYMALVAWLAYVIYQSGSKLRVIGLIAATLLAATPFIPLEYFERFETIFTQHDKEGDSIGTRKEILTDSWKIISSHPLGVGLGAFTTVRRALFNRSQETHNLYLQVTADMGIEGLVAFLGLAGSMLIACTRISQNVDAQLKRLDGVVPPSAPPNPGMTSYLEDHTQDLRLMKATTKSVLMFLVIRFGLGMFGHDFYEIYWWFAAGILISVTRIMDTASHRTTYLLNSGGTRTMNEEKKQNAQG